LRCRRRCTRCAVTTRRAVTATHIARVVTQRATQHTAFISGDHTSHTLPTSLTQNNLCTAAFACPPSRTRRTRRRCRHLHAAWGDDTREWCGGGAASPQHSANHSPLTTPKQSTHVLLPPHTSHLQQDDDTPRRKITRTSLTYHIWMCLVTLLYSQCTRARRVVDRPSRTHRTRRRLSCRWAHRHSRRTHSRRRTHRTDQTNAQVNTVHACTQSRRACLYGAYACLSHPVIQLGVDVVGRQLPHTSYYTTLASVRTRHLTAYSLANQSWRHRRTRSTRCDLRTRRTDRARCCRAAHRHSRHTTRQCCGHTCHNAHTTRTLARTHCTRRTRHRSHRRVACHNNRHTIARCHLSHDVNAMFALAYYSPHTSHTS
jgi:hypothetical protein